MAWQSLDAAFDLAQAVEAGRLHAAVFGRAVEPVEYDDAMPKSGVPGRDEPARSRFAACSRGVWSSSTGGAVPVARPIPDPLVELVARRLWILGQPVRVRLVDRLERLGEMHG